MEGFQPMMKLFFNLNGILENSSVLDIKGYYLYANGASINNAKTMNALSANMSIDNSVFENEEEGVINVKNGGFSLWTGSELNNNGQIVIDETARFSCNGVTKIINTGSITVPYLYLNETILDNTGNVTVNNGNLYCDNMDLSMSGNGSVSANHITFNNSRIDLSQAKKNAIINNGNTIINDDYSNNQKNIITLSAIYGDAVFKQTGEAIYCSASVASQEDYFAAVAEQQARKIDSSRIIYKELTFSDSMELTPGALGDFEFYEIDSSAQESGTITVQFYGPVTVKSGSKLLLYGNKYYSDNAKTEVIDKKSQLIIIDTLTVENGASVQINCNAIFMAPEESVINNGRFDVFATFDEDENIRQSDPEIAGAPANMSDFYSLSVRTMTGFLSGLAEEKYDRIIVNNDFEGVSTDTNLNTELEISADMTFIVPEGITLNVTSKGSINNHGTIEVFGKMYFEKGSGFGNHPIGGWPSPQLIVGDPAPTDTPASIVFESGSGLSFESDNSDWQFTVREKGNVEFKDGSWFNPHHAGDDSKNVLDGNIDGWERIKHPENWVYNYAPQ